MSVASAGVFDSHHGHQRRGAGMANDRPKGRGSGDRPPPTIDLQATEIAASEPETLAPDAESAAENSGARPPPARSIWPVLGGALAGGATAAIVLLIAWSQLDGSDRVVSTTDASRIEAVSQRLAKVEAAASAAPAAAADSTVAPRVAALEQAMGGLKDRLSALDQRSDKTAAAVDAVRQRADTVAASAATAQSVQEQTTTVHQGIKSLSDRLAALESATEAMRTEFGEQQATLAKRQTDGTDDRPVRLAVAAEALKLAVARGERFRAELDAAKALSSDPAPLAPLESFAARGVPTAAALGQELVALVPEMRRRAAPEPAEDASFLTRLQANAERLVRIHPIGETAGDDADAVLGRVQARAAHGNIGGVLAELDKLPPKVRAPAEAWIGKVHARDAALDAGEKFAATALGALAPRAE
jgi:hypothetical protein